MNSILILYISIISPIFLFLFLTKKELRNVFIFFILGATICLVCGEVDGFILNASGLTSYYMTVNITPAMEEVLKALPLLYYFFVFKPEDSSTFKSGISLGIGFAVLETASAFVLSMDTATIWWAIMRGLGAGLLHTLCGLGLSFGLVSSKKFKGAGLPIILGTLAISILFHSSYNILVQSTVSYFALVLTIFVYLIILLIMILSKKSRKETANE